MTGPGARPPRFEGLSALVVGGSGGIGRAVCRQLSGEGGEVTATGATAAEVADLAVDPALSGVRTAVLDVRDNASVARALAGLDRLDVLVNLAGIGRGPGEFTEDGFEATVDINLTGTMRTCYAARPLLERRGGAIVNTASMMSFFGSGTAPAYASSKGGVVQLTKSLAIALGPAGVRVNAVAPGWIQTPMTAEMFAEPVRRTTILARTPLGRLGEPHDVAEAVCFLAAPSSRFITGVVLPVDGGYLVT
jgi:NAD(P)-dependent dehydrogenase (short-subunit alcohol dehydrogenase family)